MLYGKEKLGKESLSRQSGYCMLGEALYVWVPWNHVFVFLCVRACEDASQGRNIQGMDLHSDLLWHLEPPLYIEQHKGYRRL